MSVYDEDCQATPGTGQRTPSNIFITLTGAHATTTLGDEDLLWITARDVLDPAHGNAAITTDDLASLTIPSESHTPIVVAHRNISRQWYSAYIYGKTDPGPCPVKLDQNDKWPTLDSLDAPTFYR